ncbi:MAG TPA: UbiA family prenyltransferase [Steroidobacteraceae bacterium]|jgi:4-hydroxybenzoate polyprenyltransferase|nr:UbiA family prenyltransferase [Steroidobacteraceae bacterium]
MTDAAIPLCIDFDGTLTANPLQLELLLLLAKQSPVRALAARPTDRPDSTTDVDVLGLPLRHDLIHWLQNERRSGRRLVLVVNGDRRIADQVTTPLGLFDEYAWVDPRGGSPAERKRSALVARFGEQGFDYAGSQRSDQIVWKAARRAVVVGDTALANEVRRVSDVEQVFPRSTPSISIWMRAVRLHQWVKNTLVFLPALLAHTIFQATVLRSCALAFIAFGLCASSVYLTNDLFDLAADRAHPHKRTRPLACGEISPAAGAWASLLLLLGAAAVSAALDLRFALALVGYYLLTCAYSVRLKRVALLDVMVLATLYTIRIIAGAAASNVPVSFWLLAFSVFMFMSLAFIKRYAELESTRRTERPAGRGRDYSAEDMPAIMSLGSASGLCAIVVTALYINSPESQAIYRYHHVLWLICPLMLFWISRAWMLAARGRLHDDPLVFAVQDGVSLVTLGLLVVIVYLAI